MQKNSFNFIIRIFRLKLSFNDFHFRGKYDFFDTADHTADILINPDLDKPKGASIDYENPNEVAELMAWHLARIFRATFKRKLEREVEKLKR